MAVYAWFKGKTKDKGKTKGKGTVNINCFRCGRSTHRIAECNETIVVNGNPTKPKRNPKEK